MRSRERKLQPGCVFLVIKDTVFVEAKMAVIRANPESTVMVRSEEKALVVAESVRSSEIFKTNSIEPRNSFIRTQPKVSLLVFVNIVNSVARQAIFDCIVQHGILPGEGVTEEKRQEQYKQEYPKCFFE